MLPVSPREGDLVLEPQLLILGVFFFPNMHLSCFVLQFAFSLLESLVLLIHQTSTLDCELFAISLIFNSVSR